MQKNTTAQRLDKTRLAGFCGCHRNTLTRYLAMPGAPRPDRGGRFDAPAVRDWLQDNAPRAGEGESMKRLRLEKLRLDVELSQIELDALRKSVISREDIAEGIESFCADLKRLLTQKFLVELPPLYHGRTVPEIAQLHADAVDFVLLSLKNGGDREDGAKG
jgi:hypothetical protein